MQLKNLNYLTLIPKKNVPKTSIFDKNFDTAALITHVEVDVQAIYGHRRKRSGDGKIRN